MSSSASMGPDSHVACELLFVNLFTDNSGVRESVNEIHYSLTAK